MWVGSVGLDGSVGVWVGRVGWECESVGVWVGSVGVWDGSVEVWECGFGSGGGCGSAGWGVGVGLCVDILLGPFSLRLSLGLSSLSRSSLY
ncbi:unnamed protein product [Rhizophagus irregularis]|nr:unnamed protein product [Rhizophagus irregularis]